MDGVVGEPAPEDESCEHVLVVGMNHLHDDAKWITQKI
jgi:hypothetical protein